MIGTRKPNKPFLPRLLRQMRREQNLQENKIKFKKKKKKDSSEKVDEDQLGEPLQVLMRDTLDGD